MPLEINRAPVLTLWAAVVAERLGHPADTALTLGRAVAGSAARVKARNIGREERKADRDADRPGLRPDHVTEILLSAVVAVALLTGSAAAEEKQVNGFLDGNDLLTWCSESRTARCGAYDLGVADAMELSRTDGGNLAGFRASIPPPVTSKQVEDIVTQFLREHPESRHLSAAGLVAKALAEAFPCPQ
jgi:hypothetical protein